MTNSHHIKWSDEECLLMKPWIKLCLAIMQSKVCPPVLSCISVNACLIQYLYNYTSHYICFTTAFADGQKITYELAQSKFSTFNITILTDNVSDYGTLIWWQKYYLSKIYARNLKNHFGYLSTYTWMYRVMASSLLKLHEMNQTLQVSEFTLVSTICHVVIYITWLHIMYHTIYYLN